MEPWNEQPIVRNLVATIGILGTMTIAIYIAFPSRQANKNATTLLAEEGTFEVMITSARGDLPSLGQITIHEHCRGTANGTTIASERMLHNGEAWRIRLFCPDHGTEWINIVPQFRGFVCTPGSVLFRSNPNQMALRTTVFCVPQTESQD